MKNSHLEAIQKHLESRSVEIVAVTKMRSQAEIMEIYDAGLRIFGENKVQSILERYKSLPKDIDWHMIGHLQTNKVKYIVPFIDTIQSVDSFRLLDEIEKRAQQVNRKIKVLFQIKIAKEETKYGFEPSEVMTFFENDYSKKYKFVNVCGLMGMATMTDKKDQVDKEFKSLHKLFEEIKQKFKLKHFDKLSMGMSSDYEIAIKNGSNMVRLGSILFLKSE